MKRTLGILAHWLPLAIGITGISGLVYVSIQQNYRQSLNDPQIQMVEDAVSALVAGAPPVDVVPRTLFDASESLAPFIAVYDSSGTPLEASARIGDAPPRPPIGVFQYARTAGENRVTWQPNASTRIALVARPVPNDKGWFVASGRNMREVEQRIHVLGVHIGYGLLVLLVTSLAAECLGDAWRRRLS